jgi:hypothetical protein
MGTLNTVAPSTSDTDLPQSNTSQSISARSPSQLPTSHISTDAPDNPPPYNPEAPEVAPADRPASPSPLDTSTEPPPPYSPPDPASLQILDPRTAGTCPPSYYSPEVLTGSALPPSYHCPPGTAMYFTRDSSTARGRRRSGDCVVVGIPSRPPMVCQPQREPTQDFSTHVGLACFVTWCCLVACLFGLLAMWLAGMRAPSL